MMDLKEKNNMIKRTLANLISNKMISPISPKNQRIRFVEKEGLYVDFTKRNYGELPKFPIVHALDLRYEPICVSQNDYLKACFEYIQMWNKTQKGFPYIQREKGKETWFIDKKFWKLRDALFVYFAIPYKYFIFNFTSMEDSLIRILEMLNQNGYFPQRKGFIPICNSCNRLLFPSKLVDLCHICGGSVL